MPGILTDQAIQAAIELGRIRITPWNPAQVNPCSYDLTLGEEVAVYEDWVENTPYQAGDGQFFEAKSHHRAILDVKKEPITKKYIIGKEGWVLRPGIGYLMHTAERIWTDSYVPIIDGKSSIGRLFIQIHATAGFGDVGYDGQYTLEVIVQHPVRVYAGMRIGQIRFHTLEGQVEKPYDVVGNYKNEAALGAVGSKAWRQFK